jgi:hypothetical protein
VSLNELKRATREIKPTPLQKKKKKKKALCSNFVTLKLRFSSECQIENTESGKDEVPFQNPVV